MTNNSENIKIKYGLRNDKIIHISELNNEERGLKCNCICPFCKTSLEAKLGTKNQHHFAHTNLNCDTKIAQQTALHLLAKEIIETERTSGIGSTTKEEK